MENLIQKSVPLTQMYFYSLKKSFNARHVQNKEALSKSRKTVEYLWETNKIMKKLNDHQSAPNIEFIIRKKFTIISKLVNIYVKNIKYIPINVIIYIVRTDDEH